VVGDAVPVDPERVQAVFLAASEQQSAAGRAAVLDRLCSADADLRQRVEALLRAHEAPGSFLESPAANPVVTVDEQPVSECPGTVIGPYKLLEQIGEGGFGVVFMAEQTQPVRRQVALKVIKPGMDSRQVIARFEAERQALALMDHPHIARVFDAGETAAGRPYFVMELVKGIPITDYCDQKGLTAQQRLELFVPVCQAVQHAHQKGIIHRDIKPTNVLVTLHDGTPVVKVIDFGVAKATGQQLTDKTLFTGFAQLVGTPLYMSPEQAELSGLDVDTRADIYSLGVLLYELLTSTTPFSKDRFRDAGYDEIRRIIREEEPPRPSTRISTLGPAAVTASGRRQTDPGRLSQALRGDLDWIVMKSLEKDRGRRYETASAFAADVQRYLDDLPVLASSPSAVYRLRKFARRHKAMVVSTALVGLAILLGSGASVWKFLDERAARREADSQRQEAENQRQRAQENFNEAQRQTAAAEAAKGKALCAQQEAERQRNAVYQNLYYADIRLGMVDWNAGNLARLSEKLRSHVPKTGRDDLRGWEWYYLLSLCHQDERTLTDHKNQVSSVAWSPDGRYLASTSYDNTARVWDTTSWRLLRTFRFRPVFQCGAAWSPDSQRLAWGACADDSAVYVWHVPTNEIKALRGHTFSVWTVAWSSDGKRLASAGMDRTIRIWDPATQSCIRVVEGIRDNIDSVAWDPAGSRLASVGWDSEGLRIWDTISGKEVWSDPSVDSGRSVAWSPDGKLLALGTDVGKCVLYRTADWSQAAQWEATHGGVKCVAWNPGGNWLASAGTDGLITIWDPANGTRVLTLRGHVNQVLSVAWEPDGRRMASAGMEGHVKVWRVPVAPQPRRLEGRRGGVQAIAWGQEQHTLGAVDAEKGLITFWDVATGERLERTQVLCGHAGQFSAGGGLVAIAAADEQSPRVLVYDAHTGQAIQTVKTTAARGCSFSPDGSQLALANASTLEVVDLRKNEVRFRWEGVEARARSWSPDGRLLAVAGSGEPGDGGNLQWAGWVHAFDVEKRRRVWKRQHGTSRVLATAVTWSPDGQRLVSGNVNGLAEVCDASTGRKLVSLHLHTSRIRALAWSPDSRRVASGSADRTLRIWDPSRGEELLRFDVSAEVTQVQWSADGRRLAAAGTDGAIQVWDASARRFRAEAAELLGIKDAEGEKSKP
jgi:WD40 repeat protein/serine/threonine protein kinase